MRDYFAGIFEKIGETGATGGDKKKMSPSVAPINFKRETLKAAERLMSPLVAPVPPEEIKFLYEERAAIFEFDGGLSREKAEEEAYQLALREFIKKNYPAIIIQFKSIINN